MRYINTKALFKSIHCPWQYIENTHIMYIFGLTAVVITINVCVKTSIYKIWYVCVHLYFYRHTSLSITCILYII